MNRYQMIFFYHQQTISGVIFYSVTGSTSKGRDLVGVSIILYVLYIRLHSTCETILMKYTGYMLYIYLSILVFNIFINIIFFGVVELNNIISISNDSGMEISNYKIILKISQENSDLVQQSVETQAIETNKADSVDLGNNKDECKGKNLNFLQELHKRILFADKSHFPSHFQKNVLPKISEDVPAYGNKLVTFKPSSLLQNRNLPEMSIELPKIASTNMGKLTELHKAIDGADDAVKLYDSQFIKFNKVLSGISNGTEKFYPNEAKPLMETYVDLVVKLSDQQKVMANEAISQLHKLDPKFSRSLYPVDNSGGLYTGVASVTKSGDASGGTIEQ